MDDRFSQINKFLQEEIKKTKFPAQKDKSKKKWLWLLFLAGLAILLFYLPNFFIEGTSPSPEKIIVKKIKKTGSQLKAAVSHSPANLFSDLEQPTNFLFLGVPGQGNDAPDLTDTIVLAIYQPEPKKITLVSLPRDLWLEIPKQNSIQEPEINDCLPEQIDDNGEINPPTTSPAPWAGSSESFDLSSTTDLAEGYSGVGVNIDQCQLKQGSGVFTKINSLYVLGKKRQGQDYGLELIKQKAEEITGQKIDYYVLLDLTAVKEIIDQLGGLNLLIEKDIYDPRFPGPNHTYQTFAISAGWRYLDGETALKYIRTRHTKTGDFERMGRQQQVLQAIKQKVMGLHPLWDLPSLIKIFDDLQSHMKTNLSLTDSFTLWQTAKMISPENIQTIVIDTNPEKGLLVASHIPIGDKQAYIVQPKAGLENYEEIKKFIEENQ